jgi:hypothetical protein
MYSGHLLRMNAGWWGKVSGITRTRVGDHPKRKCRASPGTTEFVVGRPGLDPGTLGLKERFGLSSPFLGIHLPRSGRAGCPADDGQNRGVR